MIRIIKEYAIFEITHYTSTKKDAKVEFTMKQDGFDSIDSAEVFLENLATNFSGEYFILPIYKKI